MNRKLLFALVFSFALSSAISTKAQTNAPNQSSVNKQPNKLQPDTDKEKRAEDRRLEAERRATATSLLFDIAEESAKFRDLRLRARVQARAGDTLWDVDQERARTLFRKAWDTADAIDKEDARRLREEVKAAMKERGAYAYRPLPRISDEVLRLAAKRDRNLGEELLKRLEESQKEEAEKAADDANNGNDDFPEKANDPYELTPSQKQRVSLATSLLDAGDTERAIQFADPALVRISMESLNFLCSLRLKNASLADQRYLNLLNRAAVDPTSDANAVSLLSSYIFTPFQFVLYGKEGSTNSSNFSRGQAAPFDNQELIQSFIRFAQQILLRPAPGPQEQIKQTTGNWGKFKTIQRLMPYFERYAPSETVTALRAQMGALRPGNQPTTQPDDEDVFFPKTSSQDEGKDFLQRAIDRAERAKTQEERDQIYFTAAVAATHRNDARARNLIDKVEDSEMRGQLRAFVDFIFISKALDELKSQKKDDSNQGDKQKTAPKEQRASDEKKNPVTIEETLRLIRSGEITNFQRVWAFVSVARLLVKTDKQQATDLLEEAINEANRISNSNPERPQAFVGIASIFYELNRARSWEIVSDVIRASNSCETFKGEDAFLMVRIQTKGMTSATSQSLENFDLPNLFKVLAKDDLNRSISQARSFSGEFPRSTAIITIARTVLEKKEEKKTKS